MSEKNKAVVQKFKEHNVGRVTQELFALDRCRFLFSTYGYRLIYALSQSIDYTQRDFFPEYGFRLDAIFKYLGLNNNNDKYERLNAVLKEILETPLSIKEQTKKGTTWRGYAWITKYEFSENEPIVYIRINEDVKPFLLDLKQYAPIRPKDYLNLTTSHQNWFYPYLKNVVKHGIWKVEIEHIKMALGLDNLKTYNPEKNKNATEAFLNRVIGIKISKKAKIENQLAKKEGRPPRLYAWDYFKDKNKVTGTLEAITKYTDINVTASVEKKGRSYTTIHFYLSEKKPSLRKIQDADNDFGKPQEKRKRANSSSSIGSLFETMIPQMPEIKDTTLPRVRIFTMQEIERHAKESGTTKENFIRLMRLQPDGKGKYFKED